MSTVDRLTIRNLLACASISVALTACGPMTRVLPTPLDGASQREVDAAWTHLLSPVDRANRDELLNVIAMTGAYQLGVERLEFRSQKQYANGTVIMEVRHDRLAPQDDRVTVIVLDKAGVEQRREQYTRTEVEQVYAEMSLALATDQRDDGLHSSIESRGARVAELFPLGARAAAERGTP